MLTAVLLFYYESRYENLLKAITALKGGSLVPNEIIVWNNGPKPLPDALSEEVTVIDSSHNFGCLVRHSIALMAANPYVLFQDDDLQVTHETVRLMYEFCKRTPCSIVGAFGSVLGNSQQPYLSRVNFWHVKEVTPVDIVLGRIHMCDKEVLLNALQYLNLECPSVRIFREDDILLSVANAARGGGNFVLPLEYVELDDCGDGLSRDPVHYRDRDQVCRTLLSVRGT